MNWPVIKLKVKSIICCVWILVFFFFFITFRLFRVIWTFLNCITLNILSNNLQSNWIIVKKIKQCTNTKFLVFSLTYCQFIEKLNITLCEWLYGIPSWVIIICYVWAIKRKATVSRRVLLKSVTLINYYGEKTPSLSNIFVKLKVLITATNRI